MVIHHSIGQVLFWCCCDKSCYAGLSSVKNFHYNRRATPVRVRYNRATHTLLQKVANKDKGFIVSFHFF